MELVRVELDKRENQARQKALIALTASQAMGLVVVIGLGVVIYMAYQQGKKDKF